MKSLIKIFVAFTMVFFTTSLSAQSKNIKTETLKIYGNCGMCKSTIEKAGNEKNVAKVEWDKDSKMATVTYNSAETSKDEILKRIALAGYDSESFLDPDDVYENLPGCCHYERELKTENVAKQDPAQMGEVKSMENIKNKMALSDVFTQYFNVKDALVATNSEQTAISAKELYNAISKVKMGELNDKEHLIWMEILKDITSDSKMMMETKDIKKQRSTFISLSNYFYKLSKATNLETPMYYQHCPMANNGKGANWLSKENEVKNPYYGSMMLSCGKTVETIK